MILTPIPPEELPTALAAVEARLAGDATALAAFRRIAATQALVPLGVDLPEHRAAAIALAQALGIGTLDEEPAQGFSWDGQVVRTRSEAWVLLHEIAHWQLCPPGRRHLPDFGLGAGPETGLRSEADAACCTDFHEREREEQLSSLLGILWEAELGQPAILAFQEQNWLESWDRPACAAFFQGAVAELLERGRIGPDGRPVEHGRIVGLNRAA
ncbi:MAG TPA: hypothetical protein VEY95_10000 [Azospirillaceae bacterium]|nr:hypothetical protein [Azospirillaceae bacterium]